MIIEKILKLKNNKYKIIFDNEELITYDNVILENNLLFKKVITKEVYKKIINETKYYDIYNKCVKSILKCRKSEKQIKDYLIKNEVNNDDIEKIITKLKSINLINDREFARAYINDKIHLSKSGLNKIKNDLLNYNISRDIIEEELENIDMSIFNDRLEKLIIKKINTNHKYSNYELKQRILNDMINLGYKREDILNIIENNLKDNKDIIKKEYNKIYEKLSKKYNDKELEFRVIQKLYSKGFTKEEIEEIID